MLAAGENRPEDHPAFALQFEGLASKLVLTEKRKAERRAGAAGVWAVDP